MKKGILLVCTFVALSISQSASTQDFGYFGKKNLFSFFTTENFRATPALFSLAFDGDALSDIYTYKSYDDDNVYTEKKKYFRLDYRASYQRILSKKLAIGLEVAYHKTALMRYDYYYVSEDPLDPWSYGDYTYEVSTPIFKTMSYMLTFEFFDEKSIAGLGFSTAIGIGPKFYNFSTEENYRYTKSIEMVNPYPEYDKGMMAINAFYQMNYRMPLTRSLFFDIGLRFQTGILLRRDVFYKNTTGISPQWAKDYDYNNIYGTSPENVYGDAFMDNASNLMVLKTGFVFAL